MCCQKPFRLLGLNYNLWYQKQMWHIWQINEIPEYKYMDWGGYDVGGGRYRTSASWYKLTQTVKYWFDGVIVLCQIIGLFVFPSFRVRWSYCSLVMQLVLVHKMFLHFCSSFSTVQARTSVCLMFYSLGFVCLLVENRKLSQVVLRYCSVGLNSGRKIMDPFLLQCQMSWNDLCW